MTKKLQHYKLAFAPIVKSQLTGRKPPVKFPSQRKAYTYAVERWGSGLVAGGYIKVVRVKR